MLFAVFNKSALSCSASFWFSQVKKALSNSEFLCPTIPFLRQERLGQIALTNSLLLAEFSAKVLVVHPEKLLAQPRCLRLDS